MVITIKFNDNIKHDYNSFEEIVKLDNYNDIIYLDCYNNNLSSLPELPNSLNFLKYIHNPIHAHICKYFDGKKEKYFEYERNIKRKFSNKIGNWFLECRYNPKYMYCRKRLMKEYKELYG